jgi:TonB family protein
MSGKKLAIAALALGIVGLFTAGGLGVGCLLGLALAGAALARGVDRSGRDVVWAAVAANVFALATLVPLGAVVWMIHSSPMPILEKEDDSLPEPAQAPFGSEAAFVAPPPPPPPPSTTARSAEAPRAEEAAQASPLAEAPPHRVGGAIPAPRKTRHVNPVYPKDAVQARLQGAVVLECTIDVEGRVAGVKVVRGVALLTEAAIEAVRQWRYEPTQLNGVPVPVLMTVTVNFKLS